MNVHLLLKPITDSKILTVAQIMSSGLFGLDFDGDRITDLNDKCPLVAETYNLFQDQDGCPDNNTQQLDSDGDGVPDVMDMCPDQNEVLEQVC